MTVTKEKKTLKFENMKPTLVLGVICLIVAALLAVCNLVTARVIENVVYQRKMESLQAVLPGGDFSGGEVDTTGVTLPATVKAVYRDEQSGAYVMLLSTRSKFTASGQSLDATVAIGKDGKIRDIKVTSYSETKNFGDYYKKFVGKNETEAASVDLYAGITFSSTAFRDMMTDALSAYDALGGDVK